MAWNFNGLSQGLGAAGAVAGAAGIGMPLALGLGAASAGLKLWGDSQEADRQRKIIDEAYKPIEDTSAIDRQAAARQAGNIATSAGRGAQRQAAASGLTSSGAAASAAGAAQGQANDYLQQENDRISRVQERLKLVNAQMKQGQELQKMGINVNMADYIAPALEIGFGIHKAVNPQAYVPQGGQPAQEGYSQQPAPQIPQQDVQNQSIRPQNQWQAMNGRQY